jgi:hypothetical protein
VLWLPFQANRCVRPTNCYASISSPCLITSIELCMRDSHKTCDDMLYLLAQKLIKHDSAGHAQEVMHAEVWVELLRVLADGGTLKHFLSTQCTTTVVDAPTSSLYWETMSIGLSGQTGALLVCRDNQGHAEPAVRCAVAVACAALA